MRQFNFEGIGTKWQIDIYQDITDKEGDQILSLVKNRIEVFDKNYSRFRDDSLVMKMAEQNGDFVLPKDAEPMLSLYHDLYKQTGGFFTPLIGNLLSDAGYDKDYSLTQKKELQNVPAWGEVMEYKYPVIHMKKPAILDFGACGKGYLVDLVGQVLEENGILKYCIDAGGDILHKNDTPIRIGLENPNNTDEVLGVYTLKNGSICGSAGNRRKWGDFTHILNPKTLSSPKDIIAVWVASDTAIVADAIATCLFFVGADILKDKYKFEYIIIYKDFSIKKSDNFSDEIFTR